MEPEGNPASLGGTLPVVFLAKGGPSCEIHE